MIKEDRRIDYTAVCPECNFQFGSGCAPFDPTYRKDLSVQFFNNYFRSGKTEGICMRCEELMTEDDIYHRKEL